MARGRHPFVQAEQPSGFRTPQLVCSPVDGHGAGWHTLAAAVNTGLPVTLKVRVHHFGYMCGSGLLDHVVALISENAASAPASTMAAPFSLPPAGCWGSFPHGLANTRVLVCVVTAILTAVPRTAVWIGVSLVTSGVGV